MKCHLKERKEVIAALLEEKIGSCEAGKLLNCSLRTIKRYRKKFLSLGPEGLVDHRHSNNYRLSQETQDKVVSLKEEGRFRSARNIRDRLGLKVHETTVWRIFRKAGLTKENLQRVKPLQRFEAENPNDLWQTDIMGRIEFPSLGICYLIATLDDHSRFLLSGKWFQRQSKINVFQVWYEALARWGLPKEMLQDEGSQYKARVRFGEADYQAYAKSLDINLRWAKRAQTKGKIERFWRFVQDDFVREVWEVKTLDTLNASWRDWAAKYNYLFKSRYSGGITHSSRYHASERRLPAVELRSLLTIEERRKVTRESTISLYGHHYYVPPGYIGCRIWVKIVDNKLYFEAGGETFWKTRLKSS